MQDQSSETRTCGKCGENKPLHIFGKHKWGCRACMAADQRERRRLYAIEHAGEPPPAHIVVRTDAICPRCGIARTATEFSSHWGKRWCKPCNAQVEANRRLRHGYPTRAIPETFEDGTCRRCTKCGGIKPMGEFPRLRLTARHKTSSTGHLPTCKACNRAKTQAWREANLDRARATVKAAWESKGERYRRNFKAWVRAHPDRIQLHRRRRRARAMGADSVRFTVTEWRERQELFDRRCAYCWQRPKKLEQDHVRPLSRGGAHALANIVPACRGCNAKKNSKTLLEFLLTR